jgi:hypothetical protein
LGGYISFNNTCDILEGRKSALFLKVVDIVKKLEGPPLIRDSSTTDQIQMEVELSTLRVAWRTKFDDLTNFPEDESRHWLFNFVHENENQMSIA